MAADELGAFDRWLTRTEQKLNGGQIVRPGTIVDACQALSKAKELRAEFEKKEKPLTTAKELIGDKEPEIARLTQKCDRIKTLAEFYLSKVEALCVLWASGQVNADLPAIEKVMQASGSKVKMSGEDLKKCVLEIQSILVV
jgi:hypothetical protein